MITFWEDEEVAIAVYFASRNIRAIAIVELLKLHGYKRTLSAVRRKLRDVTSRYAQLKQGPDAWNTAAVDAWIQGKIGQEDEIIRLKTFGETELGIVTKVRGLRELRSSSSS